jgi:hypothetical protein
MKKSKFYKRNPLKDQVVDFLRGLLFWKGRKKGVIHTANIKFDDIRKVFFPRNFHEKYRYLGSIPYSDKKKSMLHALVLAMDAEARPWWCPRWFLRFLHLFGSDNSIVRVRNRTLHNLENKITSGILMWDYKYKWTDYDLRISISAPQFLQDLADAIENDVYRKGLKQDLLKQIKAHQPNFDKDYLTNHELQDHLNRIENEIQS